MLSSPAAPLFRNLSVAISTSSVVGQFNHSFLSSDLFFRISSSLLPVIFKFKTVLQNVGSLFLEYHDYYLLILR